jgi:hypothetical protein
MVTQDLYQKNDQTHILARQGRDFPEKRRAFPSKMESFPGQKRAFLAKEKFSGEN